MAGSGIWRELFWAVESFDSYLAVQYISIPNPTCPDCDGSIVGKSIASNLAAPYEQLAEDLAVAEHLSIRLEKVKLWLAQALAASLFSNGWSFGVCPERWCAERRFRVHSFECRVAEVKHENGLSASQVENTSRQLFIYRSRTGWPAVQHQCHLTVLI